jgi:hypothetical protein
MLTVAAVWRRASSIKARISINNSRGVSGLQLQVLFRHPYPFTRFIRSKLYSGIYVPRDSGTGSASFQKQDARRAGSLHLEPEIVIHRDCQVLLGAIALGGLMEA